MLHKFISNNRNNFLFTSGLFLLFSIITKIVSQNELIVQLFLIGSSIIGLFPTAIYAIESLKVRVMSIDVLVTTAVVGAVLIQNFEESAMVTFLFQFGNYLECRTLDKTRLAIQELVAMAPKTALKQIDKDFVEVPIDNVDVGDLILVKTGGMIPVDGIVISGEASINESSITGESMPESKTAGDSVYAGTFLENGAVKVIAKHIGEDSTFGKIIELVMNAQDSKSSVERFINRFAKYYTPVVFGVSILSLLLTKNIEQSITILVLGCPGALVIGVPVSNVAGIGNGARSGVLFKGSEVIQTLRKVNTVLFDKTGTLTLGKPSVSGVHYYGEVTEADIRYLVSVEQASSHPLANAILEAFGEVDSVSVDMLETVKGKGLIASVDDHKVLVGNQELLIQEGVHITSQMAHDLRQLEDTGHSIVILSVQGEVKLFLGIKDLIRESAKRDIDDLKQLKVKNLIMISGDNQGTVNHINETLQLTAAYGNMLPEDKANFVMEQRAQGNVVAFVGDGINDSPALAYSSVGIAMGLGADVAVETADVVLMQSNFEKLPFAIKLSKAIVNNMKQNVFIAIFVVVLLLIGIVTSDVVTMSVGMFVHEASILIVILNGMRLLRFKR